MEKIQQMLDDDELEYDELPKRQAAAMTVCIIKKYTYAVEGETESDEENDSASEADPQTLAKRVLITALTNPTVTDFTPLAASDAIQGLRKTDSDLVELLEIFSSDDYASYKEFTSEHSLSSIGLPDSASDALSTKIRLLTLASIAAASCMH